MGHQDKKCQHCHFAEHNFCCGKRTREVVGEMEDAHESYERILQARESTITSLQKLCGRAHHQLKQRRVAHQWPALAPITARLEVASLGADFEGPHADQLATELRKECLQGCEEEPPGIHKHQEPAALRWREQRIRIANADNLRVELFNVDDEAEIVVFHALPNGRLQRNFRLKDLIHGG